MSGAAGLTGVVPETLPVSFAAERTSAKDEAGERRITSDPAPRGTVPKDGSPRNFCAVGHDQTAKSFCVFPRKRQKSA